MHICMNVGICSHMHVTACIVVSTYFLHLSLGPDSSLRAFRPACKVHTGHRPVWTVGK